MDHVRIKAGLLARPPARMRFLAGVAALIGGMTITAVTGCAVGPDYAPPAPPATDRYTPEPLAPSVGTASQSRQGQTGQGQTGQGQTGQGQTGQGQTGQGQTGQGQTGQGQTGQGQTGQGQTGQGQAGQEGQSFVEGRDIPAAWWTLYHSEPLNRLIADALKASPTLESAKAALREARENVYAQQGAFYPSLSASVSATREKESGAAFGIPGLNSLFSVTTGELNVSYTPDVFGGTRRTVESYAANAEYERYELAAAYLTLTSNVVTAAIQEASLRAQIAATQRIVDIETDELKVLQGQLALGGVAGGAVLAQQATLAQDRASLPPLQKQLAQQRNQLAVLAGHPPSDDLGVTFELGQLQLPGELPVSLPSKLVSQRPDIRAAESQLHQANAQIGVATANELPQISLTGSFGSTASPPGGLFGPGTEIWSLAGSLTQKLFDGGALLHQRRAAVAARDQAAAQYRSTVLSAFQDVANALRALQSDADALAADIAAEDAADRSLTLSQEQYKVGAITYTTLLNAEQTALQTHVTLVEAEAARYSDTAALFQALGGGWWNDTSGALEGGLSEASENAGAADKFFFQ